MTVAQYEDKDTKQKPKRARPRVIPYNEPWGSQTQPPGVKTYRLCSYGISSLTGSSAPYDWSSRIKSSLTFVEALGFLAEKKYSCAGSLEISSLGDFWGRTIRKIWWRLIEDSPNFHTPISPHTFFLTDVCQCSASKSRKRKGELNLDR